MKKACILFVLFNYLLLAENYELIDAIKSGLKSKVFLILDKEYNLEEKDKENGDTPLIWAIRKKDNKILDLLLEKKVQINNSNNKGQSPLIIAVDSSNIYAVNKLLAFGADMEAKDNNGLTGFDYAVNNNNRQIIELLLSKGANINKSDNRGSTPLINSIQNGNFDLAKYLIEKGANINIGDKNNNTPLIAAINQSNNGKDETKTLIFNTQKKEICQLLIDKGANVNAQNSQGFSVLFFALNKGYFDISELLYKKGANINQCNSNNDSLFKQLIVSSKSANLFEFFNKKELSVNAMDSEGLSLIQNAVIYRNIPALSILLKNNGNINIQNRENKTALHLAVEKKLFPEIELLLLADASLKIKDNNKKTPLDYADDQIFQFIDKLWETLYWSGVKSEKTDSIEKSLSKGVSTDLLNSNNVTALYYSYKNKKYQSFNCLADNGAYDDDTLNLIIKEDNLQMFAKLLPNALKNKDINDIFITSLDSNANKIAAELLKSNISLEFRSKDGKTPVFYSINNVSLLKSLVSKGANINVTDFNGNTPLFYSVTNDRYLETTKYLVSLKAKVNQKNSLKEEPVLWAARSKAINSLAFLLDNGANINAQDFSGNSMLFYAAEFNNEKFAKYLLDKGINPNLKNTDGLKASDVSISPTKETIENYFINKILQATLSDDINSFISAYDKGENSSYADSEGNNLLLISAKNNSLAIVKYLINEKKTKINSSNKAEMNALHLAIVNGNTSVAKFLIEKGIDCKKADDFGKTPLSYAIEYNNLLIADILMKKK